MTKNQRLGFIILASSLSVLLLLLIPIGIKEKAEGQKRNEITQKAKEIETKKAETKINVKPADEVVVNGILGDFTSLINKKDFDKAYAMIDESYAKDFELTKDTFKDRYNFDNERKLVIENIDSKLSDRWIVDLVFQDTNAPKDTSMVRKTFTILKKADGKYSFVDIGLIAVKTLDTKQMVRPSVIFTLSKLYVQPKDSIAIITVDNKSKGYVALQDGRFAFYAKEGDDTYEHRIVNNLSEDYIITPGIPRTFVVQFKQVKNPDTIGIYFKERDNSDKETDGTKTDVFKIR